MPVEVLSSFDVLDQKARSNKYHDGSSFLMRPVSKYPVCWIDVRRFRTCGCQLLARDPSQDKSPLEPDHGHDAKLGNRFMTIVASTCRSPQWFAKIYTLSPTFHLSHLTVPSSPSWLSLPSTISCTRYLGRIVRNRVGPKRVAT